jgi:hypothetical protein
MTAASGLRSKWEVGAGSKINAKTKTTNQQHTEQVFLLFINELVHQELKHLFEWQNPLVQSKDRDIAQRQVQTVLLAECEHGHEINGTQVDFGDDCFQARQLKAMAHVALGIGCDDGHRDLHSETRTNGKQTTNQTIQPNPTHPIQSNPIQEK